MQNQEKEILKMLKSMKDNRVNLCDTCPVLKG